MYQVLDPVGVWDIASRLGVGLPCVSQWIKRYSNFPTPVFTISNGTRIWEWSDIAIWFDNRNQQLSNKEN